MNESVTPASGNKTHAHRRARSRAAEGAGARAAAQPSPEAASHQAAFSPERGGTVRTPGSRSPEKSAIQAESPLGIKKLKFLLVYYVLWAPTMSQGPYQVDSGNQRWTGQDPWTEETSVLWRKYSCK